MTKELLPAEQTEFLFYTSPHGEIKVDVLLLNENIWMPQKKMAELFGVDSDTISYHLKNIYKDEELNENVTTEEISVVQSEGNRQLKRKIKFL